MGDAEGPLVLVLDDDPSIVQLLDLYLTDEGFRVRTASDGKAAVASALEVRPDVLVLDVMTPEMSGIEVVQRLRGEPDLCDVPVVLLSAYSDDETIARGLLAGANAYVSKPFDLDALSARLRLLIAAAAASPGRDTTAPVVHSGAGRRLRGAAGPGAGRTARGRARRGRGRPMGGRPGDPRPQPGPPRGGAAPAAPGCSTSSTSASCSRAKQASPTCGTAPRPCRCRIGDWSRCSMTRRPR